MTRKITFTDTDNRKWRVLVRAWYQHKITGAKSLKDFKQKAADEQRARGRENLAQAIERKTIIDWGKDSGVFSWKERIKE